MSIDEMKVILRLIAGVWSSFTANDEKAVIWHKVIGDIGFKDAQNAIYKLANFKTDGFAPSPGEIRASIIETLKPHLTKTGEEAWEEVTKAISKYGFYRQVELLDSLEARTRKAVGYVGLYNVLTSTKPEFIKKDFVNYYNDFSEREFEKESTTALFQALLKEGV